MHEPPRVLLVEDDDRMAAFVQRGLADAGYQIERKAGTTTGPEPDLIIVSGLHQLAPARQIAGAPVLLLTAKDCAEERIRGLDAGADDVLAKPFVLEELLARARALLRRCDRNHAAARRGTLIYGDIKLDQDSREAFQGGRKLELRNRAFELLAYFLSNPERVLRKSELLEQVWGYAFLGDSNVIEVTIGHLRQALQAGGEQRVIQTVRPVGYMLKRS
jgi:two-component system, OmpR family, response regulator MprA